jgi:hypothetical protein
MMVSRLLTRSEGSRLVDLSSVALRALNVSRNEPINTNGDLYPVNRKWAEAIEGSAISAGLVHDN